MRVLGIDPGLQCTGYGIIERSKKTKNFSSRQHCRNLKLIEVGIIRTASKEKFTARLKKIYTSVVEIIAEHKPSVLVLEDLYSFYKNPSTAIKMAHARGVISLAAANMNVEVVGYAAKRVKKAVTGSGAARKTQMQMVVKEVLGLKALPKPHDIADALALALTYIDTLGRKL